MSLLSLFQPKSRDIDEIVPIPFVENLWNHEWHAIQFQVAGVTFENRQSILKKLDQSKLRSIHFRKATYEDEQCVEVYVNDKMVGYVPRKRLNEFLRWSEKPCSIKYQRISQKDNTYGFTICVVFQDIVPIEERERASEELYVIVGADYECRKNKKKMRKDVIKKMHVNDKVLIERYTYNGEAAYMVVDRKSNVDLGVLNAGVAEYLSTKYPNAVFDAYLHDKFENSYHVHITVYIKRR